MSFIEQHQFELGPGAGSNALQARHLRPRRLGAGTALAAALLAGWAAAAEATGLNESPAIAERIALHKKLGVTTKRLSDMLRGDAMFNLAAVQAGLDAFAGSVPKVKTLFPPDSKTGGGTKALPEIWSRMPEFLAIYDKLAEDSNAARAAIKDEASFKTEFPRVVRNCSGCHRNFKAR